MRLRTLVWRSGIVVGSLTVVLIVSAVAWNFRQVHRANKAWQSFRNMRAGTQVSTSELTSPWTCTSNRYTDCIFVIGNWPFPETPFWVEKVAKPLARLRLPLWLVVGEVSVDGKGVVQHRRYLVGMAGTDAKRDFTVTMWDSFTPLIPGCNFSGLRHPEYNVEEMQEGRKLQIGLGPTAEAWFAGRATDINFQCLTSIRGCHSISALAPSAWEDFVIDRDNAARDPSAVREFIVKCLAEHDDWMPTVWYLHRSLAASLEPTHASFRNGTFTEFIPDGQVIMSAQLRNGRYEEQSKPDGSVQIELTDFHRRNIGGSTYVIATYQKRSVARFSANECIVDVIAFRKSRGPLLVQQIKYPCELSGSGSTVSPSGAELTVRQGYRGDTRLRTVKFRWKKSKFEAVGNLPR